MWSSDVDPVPSFFSKVGSGSDFFFEDRIRIRFFSGRSDPDPFFSGRSDPDPVFSRRSDPDPAFSRRSNLGKPQLDPQYCTAWKEDNCTFSVQIMQQNSP